MTATIDRPDTEALEDDVLVTSLVGPPEDGAPPQPDDTGAVEEEAVEVALRPLLVAGLSTAAAALTVGGIFGSWGARLFCLLAGALGVGWAALAARSPKRRTLYQAALPFVIAAASVVSLTVGAEGGPANLPSLVREAIKSGNLLRPPIPFDAGWRPVLLVVMVLLGFAAGAAASVFERPRLALVVPLPLLGLAAISQPEQGQALAGLLAVLPVIGALAVLFGSEGGGVSQLSRDFELRRMIKAAFYVVGIVVAITVLNSTTSVLFPAPAYNPAQEAQKPKPVPLGAAEDRVLFEIDGPITGPWKMGSLDEYDGSAWRLPPYDPKKLKAVPAGGVIDPKRGTDVTVSFTVRDLGVNSTLPGVTGPTKFEGPADRKFLFDPRAGTFRVPSGRVPTGLTYKQSLPTYPTPEQLRVAAAAKTDRVYTEIPPPPRAVRELLNVAPSDPWDRLDFMLRKLTEVVVAAGAGEPKDVPPAKVQQLLAGNHEGSPYEIVAAQAMLARWAGMPSRIGFGFDGLQEENGVRTVRPQNATQWLEVNFEGHGWIPIITQPPKAKASLDNDATAKFDPAIQAGSDVAVQVYIPVKVKTLVQLYQQVRRVLAAVLPIVVLLLGLYLATPWMLKTWRRAKRRRWAEEIGPEAVIAVEYCELRDLATDLGIGDPYATPIEYLDFVAEDEEHEEMAWLVTKALYGEMRGECRAEDASAARELGDSIRQRLMKAQPLQSRALAMITKLSLQQPYSLEVPAVRVPWRSRA